MMKEKQAEILLAAVITARATSFIFAKWCLAGLDTFNLLAFPLLGVLFFRKLRGISLRTVGRGALMGGAVLPRHGLRGVRPAHGGHVRRLRAGKHRHYSRAAV